MSIKCVHKSCGWYKEYNEGNEKSNCKMYGAVDCDFSTIVTPKKHTITLDKLFIEDLRNQFEEAKFNASLDFSKDGCGDYLDYTTFERWNGYFVCAKINNTLREEK